MRSALVSAARDRICEPMSICGALCRAAVALTPWRYRVGAREQRQRIADSTRRLAAGVPRDQDSLAQFRKAPGVGHEQHRATDRQHEVPGERHGERVTGLGLAGDHQIGVARAQAYGRQRAVHGQAPLGLRRRAPLGLPELALGGSRGRLAAAPLDFLHHGCSLGARMRRYMRRVERKERHEMRIEAHGELQAELQALARALALVEVYQNGLVAHRLLPSFRI
jgi:hypothetical protein